MTASVTIGPSGPNRYAEASVGTVAGEIVARSKMSIRTRSSASTAPTRSRKSSGLSAMRCGSPRKATPTAAAHRSPT